MPITQLDGLQDAVQDHADRSDLSDTLVNTFITIMEGKLYRGERALDGKGWVRKPLRLRKMLAVGASLTNTAGVADLSTLTRFVEMKRVRSMQSTPVLVESMPPEHFWSIVASGYSASPPEYYTIEGDTMSLGPKDSVKLQVSYYQTFAAMTAASDTNWVLTNHPGVYLHGVLAEAYEWEQNDAMRDMHVARFNGLVNALDASEEEAALAGSPLVMRPHAVY